MHEPVLSNRGYRTTFVGLALSADLFKGVTMRKRVKTLGKKSKTTEPVKAEKKSTKALTLLMKENELLKAHVQDLSVAVNFLFMKRNEAATILHSANSERLMFVAMEDAKKVLDDILLYVQQKDPDTLQLNYGDRIIYVKKMDEEKEGDK